MSAVPVLMIHGGAGGEIKDPERRHALRQKIKAVVDAAYERLADSGALLAVIEAVKLLEDDPEFNAGTGSRLQSDGTPRLSASVMDGRSGHFAGVINIEKIKNPVLVAEALLREKDRVLAGEGALRFALELGMKPSDVRTERSIRLWKKAGGTGSDTVGACALDRFGNLASATSTGGKGFERPGRVSDSGTPAANFATKDCAISCTGIGEDILNEGLAVAIATRVRDGSGLKQAFSKSFREARARKRSFGAIGVDRRGRVAWDKTTALLMFGYRQGSKQGAF